MGLPSLKALNTLPPESSARKVKVLVTGAFNAGKTEFVRSACDGHVVSSERLVTGQQASSKRLTTVALDFGRLASPLGNQLLLFGAPGQERFAFAREMLAEGAAGCVLVVDCCDEQALPQAWTLAGPLLDEAIPIVVAANKQDKPGALGAPAVRQLMNLPAEIGIVECSALERESVLRVLGELEGKICGSQSTTT